MRKNNESGKKLRGKPVKNKKINGLYSTFKVTGLNLSALLNRCVKEGVFVKNVKKTGKKSAYITVNLQDNGKFFAICKDLCYNVKKIRDRGLLYPLLFLFRNVGVFVGALVFICSAYFINDVVFNVNFHGTGKVYSEQVMQYLTDCGIGRYSRFSSLDLKKLEDDILRTNENLSFASCKKHGNTLSVELVLSTEKVNVMQGNVKGLVSDVDGVVEWVRVYRGTSQVSVGDTVKKGDTLVGGYACVKDYRVDVNVLAYVGVRVTTATRVILPKDNMEETATLIATEEFTDKNLTVESVKKIQNENNFEYVVTMNYLQIYYAG